MSPPAVRTRPVVLHGAAGMLALTLLGSCTSTPEVSGNGRIREQFEHFTNREFGFDPESLAEALYIVRPVETLQSCLQMLRGRAHVARAVRVHSQSSVKTSLLARVTGRSQKLLEDL